MLTYYNIYIERRKFKSGSGCIKQFIFNCFQIETGKENIISSPSIGSPSIIENTPDRSIPYDSSTIPLYNKITKEVSLQAFYVYNYDNNALNIVYNLYERKFLGTSTLHKH